MNAYELAKKLEWYTNYDEFVESGAMLRQQADRIAELEKGVKPVAWTNQKWLNEIAKEPQLFQPLFVHGKQTEHNTIPLYTTPQIKELSNEEITEVLNDENIAEYHQGNWLVLPYAFARAILKKASEK